MEPNRLFSSIDPGLHKVAVAVWDPDDFTLIWAGLIIEQHEVDLERVQKWKNMGVAVDRKLLELTSETYAGLHIIFEVPQVYSGPRQEDPNDLIDLAGVVGAIAGGIACHDIQWSPRPREWKGQLPKEISQARVEIKLTDEEKARIEWPSKSLKHNVYDAIHLGIVYIEREALRVFKK